MINNVLIKVHARRRWTLYTVEEKKTTVVVEHDDDRVLKGRQVYSIVIAKYTVKKSELQICSLRVEFTFLTQLHLPSFNCVT